MGYPATDSEGLLTGECSPSSSDLQESVPAWHDDPSSATTGRPKHRRLSSIIIIVALAITNTISLGWITALLRRSPPISHISVNRPPSGIAPTLAHLAGESPLLVNVSFYPHDSPWRGHDSRETDELWAEYEQADAGFIMIPEEEAAQAAIDPSRHAYVDRPDLGMVGYPVLPEAIHEMHCVNMLRRNLYYNREFQVANCRPPFCVPEAMESWDILHIDHCLEILRRRVACTADLGIVPFMWYKNTGKLTGENARMHTCGNYDAIKDFVAENSVNPPPLGSPNGLRPPESAFVLDDYE